MELKVTREKQSTLDKTKGVVSSTRVLLKTANAKMPHLVGYVAQLGMPPTSKPMKTVHLVESKVAEAYREIRNLERFLEREIAKQNNAHSASLDD